MRYFTNRRSVCVCDVSWKLRRLKYLETHPHTCVYVCVCVYVNVVLERDGEDKTDSVKSKEVLHRVKEEKVFKHSVKTRKANWIDQILPRNWILKYVNEGKIEGRLEVTGIWERRRKQLQDDLKESRGYWKLKAESLGRNFLDRSLWNWLWTSQKFD